MGVLLETSDGAVYGMRHDNNIWSNTDIAFTVNENYTEPHGRGVQRFYEYTSELEGKTIRKITYLLKDIPDVVIDSLDIYVKRQTSASVRPESLQVMPGSNVQVKLVFSNVPSGAGYSLVSVTSGSGRNRQAVPGCTMSGDVLTISGDVPQNTYTATFRSSEYVDIAASIKVFTSDATSATVSPDNNGASLNFLVTPKGYVASVDAEMTSNDFVNATDYTDPAGNFTASYSEGRHQVEGSGFSFDVALNNIPSGDTAVIGFGKQFYLTPDNVGEELYPMLYSAITSRPAGESGFIEFPNCSALRTAGLKVMVLLPDGSARDVSDLVGAGAMVSDDTHIMLFYGVMAADCDSGDITEGEYLLSTEGETLIADGSRDGHIRVAMYIEALDTEADVMTASSNVAGIQFDTMPSGFFPSADRNAEAKKIYWLDDTNTLSGGTSSFITGRTNQISGNSGYTFTVPFDTSKIPSGYTAALGFERPFTFTASNLGATAFNALKSRMSSMTKIPGYDWVIPSVSDWNALGIHVVAEYSGGASRDVTGEMSAGLLETEGGVLLQYGAIALDRSLTSREGEIFDMAIEQTPLVSDGNADGKITVTWYITLTASSGSNGGGNSGGNGGGTNPGGNGGGGPASTENRITSPAIDINSKGSGILQALGQKNSKVTTSTGITELPSSAMKGTQNVASPDAEAVYLPVIEVEEAKVYVFGVSVDKFAEGTPIFWHFNGVDIETGGFVPSTYDNGAYAFYDDEGNEVSKVPANQHVNVAAYLEPGITYSPTITNSATNTGNAGGSSGGCEALGGIIPAMLLGLMLALRKR